MSHSRLFLDGSEDLSRVIDGSLDPALVVLSIVVATTAACAALLIADRMSASGTAVSRRRWLIAGALAMGLGIWDMHFVGMLAFSLPVPVAYDLPRTVVSVVPGILGAGAALHFLSRRESSFSTAAVAGLAMSCGIGAMHFVGMTAILGPLEMRYSLPPFVFSIAVAHVLATTSLHVHARLREMGSVAPNLRLLMAASILGIAVSAMHYSGLAACVFLAGGGAETPGMALPPEILAAILTLGTALVLAAAIVCAIVDSRLQEISRDLRESEQRTRTILENAAEGIVSTDETGRIEGLNASAAKMLGIDPAALIGRSFSEVVPALPQGHSPLSLRAASEEDRDAPLELQARNASGELIPIALTLGETTVGDHRTVTSIFRDLSEQRRLEAQLRQVQKMEAIGQLASGIAHEINTPTQFVNDNVDFLIDGFEDLQSALKAYGMLLEEARRTGGLEELVSEVSSTLERVELAYLEEEIPRALAQSHEGLQRIATIVGAMKEFSHPGRQGKGLIDLNRVVRSTVTVSRLEWRDTAEIEAQLDEDLVAVPGTEFQISQVVLAMIVNAAQAIASVARARGEKGRIVLTTRQEESVVVLEIRDDGPGMSEDVRSRVFDPFFTTKEVGQGTGQGLSVAWSIVADQHGGSIDVESREEEGTRFRISLPIAEPGA